MAEINTYEELEELKSNLMGANVLFEVADLPVTTIPKEADWKRLGALTNKTFNFSPTSVTSEADDSGPSVQTFIAKLDLEMGLSGEMRVSDRAEEFGVINLAMRLVNQVKAESQPTLWCRLTAGDLVVRMFGVLTSLDLDSPTNSFATYNVAFKNHDGRVLEIQKKSATPAKMTRTGN